MLVADAEHDVGIHGDEAAIAVIGEAAVAGFLRQRLDGLVVEAEIEHGIHHARHRGARAGAHRHQQRIVLVAEGLAGDACRRAPAPSRPAPRRSFGYCLLLRVVVSADVGGDGEARRHRQAEIGHFGKTRALAAQQIAHVGLCPRPCRRRRRRPICLWPALARAQTPCGFGLDSLPHALGFLGFCADARLFAFSHDAKSMTVSRRLLKSTASPRLRKPALWISG